MFCCNELNEHLLIKIAKHWTELIFLGIISDNLVGDFNHMIKFKRVRRLSLFIGVLNPNKLKSIMKSFPNIKRLFRSNSSFGFFEETEYAFANPHKISHTINEKFTKT